MARDLGRAAAFRWTLVGLAAAALYACWPLWPALLLAAWTAGLGRPLLARLERGLAGRRRAAAVLSLLLFLVLSLPVALVVLGVLSGAQDLAHVIAQSSSAKAALEAIAAGNGGGSETVWPTSLPAVVDLVQRYGAQGFGVLTRLAGAAATGLVGLFMFFGGAFAFLLDGPDAWAWCKRHSPLEPEHLERYAAAFHETGRGLLVGVGLTTATQGLVATVAYLALGVPRWWVLGPITGIASVIPLVGSGLVWGPIMIGLFLTQHPVQATILGVLGLGVISTVDNVLRPIYARMGALEMPMFLVFISIFGGITAFGTWGALLGPLLVRLFMEGLAMRREQQEQGDPPGE